MIASRNPSGKLGLVIAVLFTLSLITLFIALPIGYVSTIQDLPSTETLPSLLEPPNGILLHPTQIYDRTGRYILQTVQNPVIKERRYLPISEKTDPQADEFISDDLVSATISIVDQRKGLRLLRSARNDVLTVFVVTEYQAHRMEWLYSKKTLQFTRNKSNPENDGVLLLRVSEEFLDLLFEYGQMILNGIPYELAVEDVVAVSNHVSKADNPLGF